MPEFDRDDYFGSLKKTQARPTLGTLIDNASEKTGVPKNLLGALIKQESGGDPNAVGKSGEYGLTQIMEGTWKDIQKETGLTDITDPRQQVEGGAYYLGKLIDRYGSVPLGLAAYNTGPGNVDKGRIPASTKRYVDNIMAMSERNLSDAKLRSPGRSPANELRQRLGELDRKAASGELSGSSGFDLDAYFKKMYPPAELTPEPTESGGFIASARDMSKIAGASFAESLLRAIGGQEHRTEGEEDWRDQWVRELNKYQEEVGAKMSLEDKGNTILGLPAERVPIAQGIGYSASMIAPSLVGGLAGSLIGPAVGAAIGATRAGSTIGAALGGTRAGVAVANAAAKAGVPTAELLGSTILGYGSAAGVGGAAIFKSDKSQFVDSVLDKMEMESIKERGSGLSLQEKQTAKQKMDESADEHALIEAFGEVVSNLVGWGIVRGAKGIFGRVLAETNFGKKMMAGIAAKGKIPESLRNVIAKVVGVTTEELATEEEQARLQSYPEAREGLRERPATFTESLKDVTIPTLATTGLFLGLGGAGSKLYNKLANKGLEPKEPPPAESDVAKRFDEPTPGGPLGLPALQERLALPAPEGRLGLPPGQGFEMHGEPYDPSAGPPDDSDGGGGGIPVRPLTWQEAQKQRRQTPPSPTVDLDDVLIQTDPGLRDYIEAVRDNIQNVRNEEDAVNVANQIKSLVDDAPPQAVGGLVQDLRRQLERLRVGMEGTIGMPQGQVSVPWKKAEQPTTETVPPPTQAAASQLQEQTVLDDSTLGQIEDRILSGEDMTNELKAVIAKQGKNVFQDWLNPQKMGARLAKKQAEETGVPLKDAYRSITDTMKRYEEAYRLVSEGKAKRTVPINKDLTELIKQIERQELPGPGTPVQAPATESTIPKGKPTKTIPLNVDLRQLLQQKLGQQPMPEPGTPVVAPSTPEEFLKGKLGEKKSEAPAPAPTRTKQPWEMIRDDYVGEGYVQIPEKQEPATDSEEFFEFKDDLNRRGAARTAQGVDYKIIQVGDSSYGYTVTRKGNRVEHRGTGARGWSKEQAVSNAIKDFLGETHESAKWHSDLEVGDPVKFYRPGTDSLEMKGRIENAGNGGVTYKVRGINGLVYNLYAKSGHAITPTEKPKTRTGVEYKSPSLDIRDRTIEKARPFLSASQSEDALLATIEKYAKEAYGEVVIERSQLDYPASDSMRASDIEYLNKWDSGRFARAVLNYIKEKEEFDKAPAPPPQQDFGAGNKLFTKDKADRAREILRRKLSQVNMGLDPEMVQAGIDLAGYYIEGGARKFVDYAKRMIEDLGESATPYLKSWYMGVRFYPDFDSTGMDGAAHVEALDVDALLGTEEIGHEDATQETETRGDPGHPRGDRTLEGVPADNVPESERGWDVAEGSDKGGGTDLRGAVRDDLSGSALSPGVGDGEGAVHVSPGGRGTRGGGRRRASSGGRVASDSGSHEPPAPGGRGDREPSGKTENEGYPPQTVPASDHAPFRDYTITDLTQLGEGGQKTKYRNNVAAIRLLRDLEATGRKATAAEQDILARYVGWGALPQAFDAENDKWSSEYSELKDLLEDDEYQSAFQSTQYGHYTSDTVIRGIYGALKHLGFSGGSILEPGCGVGNFVGLMPEALRTASRFTGIERERIAAGIAKHLYPNQNMLEKDFTYFNVPNETFDLTVGNPPFGKIELTDMSGRKHLTGLSIHNYFISKAVEMTRPGGIIAVVVSRFFMDAKNSQTRRYLGDRTRLLGAIRLPNTAFTKNAGTEVTTDIIFLQKRPESEFGSRIAKEEAKAWMDTGNIADPHGREPMEVNQYYIDHPEMLMGRMERTGSMRGAFEPTLAPNPDVNLSDAINEAIKQLPKDVFEARTGENTRTILDATAMKLESPDVDPNGHFVKDDKLYKRIGDFEGAAYAIEIKPETMFSAKQPYGKNRIDRIKQLAKIRFTARALIAAETRDDMKQANKLRKKLNQQYDAFAAKNGPINKKSNLELIRDDPDAPLLMALEMDFDKGITEAEAKKQGIDPVEPSAAKSPIFSVRVVPKKEIPTSADTPQDAIMISLAERGHIDAAFVGKLLNQDGEKVLSDMAEEADSILFLNPATREYELRDAYLSGNVRRKLHEAERAGMVKNIEALTNVIPEDVPPHEIQGFIGSPWIPTKVYEDFIKGLLGEEAKVSVKYVPVNSSFVLKVENSSDVAEQTTFGTARCPATRILNSLLNSKEIKVTETDRDGKVTVLRDETDNANDKAREIKDRFADWLFAEDLRSEQVTRAFNDANNNYVKRQYDGSWLAFAGKVADNIIKFRRHQNNGIARIIQSRTSLLDHVVGSGKTFTMISAAMEMKRMGIIQKPLFTVPNHLVKQWAAEFYRLYPGAKILAATKKDFERKNRRAFLAKVATGNWDAVIMAHSSFGFIRPDPAVEKMVNEKMIKEISAAINSIMREDSDADGELDKPTQRTVKQLAQMQERLENRLKRLRDKAIDDIMDFEQLGFDQLFVDEAHLFKNLLYFTKQTNISGLGNAKGSQRAWDMYLKVQQIFFKNGRDQGVVFATGTPVSNSLAEMFHMMRYLMPTAMEENGYTSFDAWANTYAEVTQEWMQSFSGIGYKQQNRMSTFVNALSLLSMFDQVADTVSNDDLKKAYAEDNNGKEFPLPKLKGGKRQAVSIPRSEAQKAYMENVIAARAEALKTRKRKPKKGDDNSLWVMTDARKAAMDMRLVDPTMQERDPNGRIAVVAKKVAEFYKKYADVKGTQLVFSDMGTPKKQAAKELKAYQELQDKAAALEDEEMVAMAELGDEAAMAKIEAAEDAAAKLVQLGKDYKDAIEAAMRGFSIYDDLKDALVELGIPEREIAFIHDFNTDDQKAALFAAVNQGRIRVLLGSTPKLGAGTNVQERLVALHHVDIPWKPSDVEQREGRIIRQGNRLMEEVPNFEIEILSYATQDTLDLRMWQTQEKKLSMIAQLRDRKVGNIIENAFEDMILSAEEMQAAASSNPYILQDIQIRDQITKLERQRRSHDAQVNELKRKKRNAQQNIKSLPEVIENREALDRGISKYKDAVKHRHDDFAVTINGERFTDVEQAGNALQRFVKSDDEEIPVKIQLGKTIYTDQRALMDACFALINKEMLLDPSKRGRTLEMGEQVMMQWGQGTQSSPLFKKLVGQIQSQVKAFKKENKGKWPPPISVEFNGETYKSRTKLSAAYRDIVGDLTNPILWTAEGRALNQAKDIVRHIEPLVEKANREGKRVEVGRLGDIVVEISPRPIAGLRGEETVYVTLHHQGKSIQNYADIPTDRETNEADYRGAAHNVLNAARSESDNNAWRLGNQTAALERARKDLAELEKMGESGAWAKDDELQNLRQKHREVLRKLADLEAGRGTGGQEQPADSPVREVAGFKVQNPDEELTHARGFREFYTSYGNVEGEVFLLRVSGKPVTFENAPGMNFFTYQSEAGNWHVIDQLTGLDIFTNKSQTLALVGAEGILDNKLQQMKDIQERSDHIPQPGGTPLGNIRFFLSQGAPAKSASSVSRTSILSHFAKIARNWKNRPKIYVVQSESQLPKVYAPFMVGQEGDVYGFYDPTNRSAWFIADNMPSLEQAELTLFHEVLGHHGLREFVGEDFNSFLDQVYNHFGKFGLAKIARDNGFDLSTKEGQRAAADEKLANMAQKGTNQNWLQKAWVWFKNWLRKAGFSIKPSYGDFVDTVRRAGEYVKSGEGVRVKLPDAVTYDDQGRVIPLSQRFDPTNPDIRFSLRAPTEVVSDHLKKNLTKQGIDVTFGNTKQLRPIRDGMLRLPYWLAKTNETVKKFFGVERKRSNDRATMLYDDLQETQPVFNLDDKQTKELSDVAFGMEKNGARIQKEDIKVSKFVRVGDRQISIGKGAQKEVRNVPNHELNEAHYQELDKYLTAKGISPAVRKAYIATRKKLDSILLKIHDRMAEMEEIDPTMIAEYRRQIGRINFYFPHNRYGNSYVQVVDSNKDVIFRQHFNAVGEVSRTVWFNKNKAKIESKLKELNKDVDLASLKWRVAKVEGLPEEVYDFPIPVDAMQQIIDAGISKLPDESEKAKAALRSAMSEAVSDVMKSRGFGSHMIERKNIPGFERENMQRVLFDYLAGYSGWLTKMDAARQYGKMLGDVDARKTPNDYSWAVKYTKDMLENATLWDRVADSARGAFFLYYLGANIKSAAVNLTQNIVAGVPRLSMEGKGAFSAWAKALKDFRITLSEEGIKSSNRFNAEEKKFIIDMLREGWGQARFVSAVTGRIGGPTKTMTTKALRFASAPMEIAEKYNRLSLGLAAFRMARAGKVRKQKGTALTYESAKSFAEEVVEDAHFVYGKGNRPGVFRGNEMAKMASTTYTFRTFTHNLLSMWRWMITHNGKEGALAFAYSMGGIILLGGLSAAPFYQTLATLFRQMFGEDYLRKMTRDMAPNQLRDIVSYGVPSLVGVNIGGSLGMEVPVLDRYRADQKPSEQLWRGMFEVSGIPGSMLTSFFDNVIGGLASGNPSKLADFILPTAGQNIKRAYELYTYGQYTQTGRPISLPGTQEPTKLTGGQALVKVIGFQPTAMTKGYDIYRTKEDLEGYKRRHQSAMVDAYMRAKNRGDLKGMQRVREKVAEWNKTAIASGDRQNIIDITKSVKTRSRPDRGPKAFRAKAMEIEEAYR